MNVKSTGFGQSEPAVLVQALGHGAYSVLVSLFVTQRANLVRVRLIGDELVHST